jgi:integrase
MAASPAIGRPLQHRTAPSAECATLLAEPIHAEPSKGERMARREFQMPTVLRYEGPRPYWYIRYRRKVLVGKDQIERKEVWHQLGDCEQITKRQAQRLRDEVMREVNREVYTLQSQVPFGDFVDIYKKQHVPTLAAGAQAKYCCLLDGHILPAFQSMKLCDIDTEAVQTFLNGKAKAGLAWWTRNDLKNIMSGVFSKADDWGYWSGRNPVRKTTIGRMRAKRQKRILSDEQLRLLLAGLPEQIRMMVETAISTGMRVSEIIGLKWRCVDLNRGLVRVEERYYRGDVDAPKTEHSRRILPLGQLVECYRQRKPTGSMDDQYVFHCDGEPLDDRAILQHVIRPLAKRLGFYFEGFGWHSFRRQNLTLIQEEGASAFEAMAQAGHSRPAMTSEYTIIGLQRREQAVLKVQQRLLQTASESVQ